jgi:hypothetical protein
MKKQKQEFQYVWCCEDDKYGNLSVHATEESAVKWLEKNGWHGGNGEILKRKIMK